MSGFPGPSVSTVESTDDSITVTDPHGPTVDLTNAGGGGGGITQLTGDVTAGPGTGSQAATLAKIDGTPVSAASPVTGQVLGYDGTDWTGVTAMADADGDSFTLDGAGNADVVAASQVSLNVGSQFAQVNANGFELVYQGVGEAYIHIYNGDPNGHVTALVIGDLCVDTVTPALWQASAADNAHWVEFSSGGGLPAWFQTGDGNPITNSVTPNTVGGLYFDTSGSSGLFTAAGATSADWMALGSTTYQSGLNFESDGSGGFMAALSASDGGSLVIANTTASGQSLYIATGGNPFNLFAYPGNPNGHVTAKAEGDLCVDTSTPALWQATAADNSHWVPSAAFSWDDGTDGSSFSITTTALSLGLGDNADILGSAGLTLEQVGGTAYEALLNSTSPTHGSTLSLLPGSASLQTTGTGANITIDSVDSNPATINLGASGHVDPLIVHLPTSDPHLAGQLWANLGIVTVSAG